MLRLNHPLLRVLSNATKDTRVSFQNVSAKLISRHCHNNSTVKEGTTSPRTDINDLGFINLFVDNDSYSLLTRMHVHSPARDKSFQISEFCHEEKNYDSCPRAIDAIHRWTVKIGETASQSRFV